ncbi:DUF5333 domain-containing protein [Algirhabdus cladophorae]|uniref:DUF5333 domain-containing protein n=1 Tax=Algirhabdus cladophorae TaxID=3377108 RepID=UPI003B849E8D
MKFIAPIVVAMTLTASPLAAATPLNQDTHIKNSLLAAAVGDEIRKNCDAISARMLVVFSKTKALERYALDQGHSEDDIKAFLKDKTERKRMEALRDAYLKNGGVTKGDSASYCALGQKEIAADSLTGQLLRSR